MNSSPSLNELATALARAQSLMTTAKKDSVNPHYHSKYADLASVVEAIRKPFAENGLSYVQLPIVNGTEDVAVETVLLHTSGQWIASVFAIPAARDDAHGRMSALTYCRRGGLAAMAGVAPDDDDDGNAANAAPPERAAPAQHPASQSMCPVCGVGAIIASKPEWGGGWVCHKKRGGCGAKWPDGPFPTAAPADPFAIQKQDTETAGNELFPSPRTANESFDVTGATATAKAMNPGPPPEDPDVLLGRIKGRFDKLKTPAAAQLRMWEKACGAAKFMTTEADVASLGDLLAKLGA